MVRLMVRRGKTADSLLCYKKIPYHPVSTYRYVHASTDRAPRPSVLVVVIVVVIIVVARVHRPHCSRRGARARAPNTATANASAG
jgi:hypothetical protein